MNFILLVLAAASMAAGFGFASRTSTSKGKVMQSASPVLVELFTSEGCSDCPPADALLAKMVREQPGVIALEEHVDYWNQLGWHDPYSSSLFSERQGRYAQRLKLNEVYTPQMVVDGHIEFLGSDEARAAGAIDRESALPRASIDLTCGGSGLKIGVGGATPGAEVWLAVTEDSLRSSVQRGENSGRVLDHTAVAREMRRIGVVGNDRGFSKTVPPEVQPGWNREHLKFVVFVQESGQGRVLGASVVSLSAN